MTLGVLSGAVPTLSLLSVRGFAGLVRSLFAGSFVAAIAELAGAVIALIAFYSYLRPGALMLREADQRYSTAATLIDIGYFWGLTARHRGDTPADQQDRRDDTDVQLHDAEKNTLYLVAGILFIVGIFVRLLTSIAWVPMYVALGESITRHASSMSAPPQAAMV